MEGNTSRNNADILRILVATDIHLGFEEKDPIRDQDTFDTFEEILELAVSADVDFILLGGDLFHHSKPSPYCIFKCTELLRRYCLGDRPVQIEFLSDPSHNFSNSIDPMVNYEDPNLNVAIPVFSIHGNHDDPTGHQHISAMDLLASSGLVNYFGRCNSYDEVHIEPILLRKGETKLALYGLSHIKDERLGRLFLDKKVKMLSPEGDKKESNEWFHLLVWHQNRAIRGVKNFIPDDTLPKFLDLVIWGHEHDCRIEPEQQINDVYISQPGSSVATSLAEGESRTKKVGILHIHGRDFKLTPVELKTVRPFIFKDLILKSVDDMLNEANNAMTPAELTLDFIKSQVDGMIEEAKTLGRTDKVSRLPLIRLNIKYGDEKQIFNAIRFGQSYIGKVANPEDMIKCNPYKETVRKKAAADDTFKKIQDFAAAADRVEDIVLSHFAENDIMKCLPLQVLNEAVKKYIDSNDTDAPMLATKELIKETMQKLEEAMPEVEECEDFILNFKLSREKNSLNHITQLLNDPNRQVKHSTSVSSNADDDDVIDIDDDDDDDINMTNGASTSRGRTKPARGAGSRGGRGSRGARGAVASTSRGTGARGTRGRGKGRAKTIFDD